MASFEITDTTILKILVRRGLDSERKNVALTEGELGYTVDTKRVFVGDGLLGGGTVVGNKFLGSTPDIDFFINNTIGIQPGDFVFDTDENILYVMGPVDVNGNVTPTNKIATTLKFLESNFDRTPFTPKQIRINEAVFGKFVVNENSVQEVRRKAFYFDHAEYNNFYNVLDVVDLNPTYWSLSSTSNFKQSENDGAFFVGNVYYTGTSALKLDYRLNVDARAPMTGALRVNSNNNNSEFVIGGSGDAGNNTGLLKLFGLSGMSFYHGSIDPVSQQLDFSIDEYGYTTFYKDGGNYQDPDFEVRGYSKFLDNMYIGQNLTVFGNISAYGDLTVFDTTITTYSGLSVLAGGYGAGLYVRKDYQGYVNSDFDEVVNFSTDRNDNVFVFDENGYCQIGNWPAVNREYPGAGGVTYSNAMTSVHIAGGLWINNMYGNLTQKTNGELRADITGPVEFVAGNFGVETIYGQCIGDGNNVFIDSNPTTTRSVYTLIKNSEQAHFANAEYRTPLEVRHTNQPDPTLLFDRPVFITSTNQPAQIKYTLISGKAQCIGGPGTIGNGTEVFRVAASGDIRTDGSIALSGNVYALNVYARGDVVAFYTVSDKTVKTKLKIIPNALDKVDSLHGYEFSYNDQAPDHLKGKRAYGLIAQELKELLPHAVEERSDGKLGIDYEQVVPLLIQAIKELHKLVKEK